METKRIPLVDLSKITIDPNMKSSANDPFILRKVEQARKTLANVDLSILNLPPKK